MKFLIIRLSSIGDIVLTSPVVRCLKKQVPTAEIHYLTKYAHRKIVESNPYITKVHLLDESLTATISHLKLEHFDYIIDLHNNLRTAKIKRALKKNASFSFNKLNIEKWLLVNLKINRLPNIHIVDRYLETVKSFGVVNDGLGLDYFIPKNETVKESDLPMSHQVGFIGVVIGAALNTKKLPILKLKNLLSNIDHPIILLGGPEDKIIGNELAAADPHKIYNACGKFSLNESADLVRRSKLIITHDTGLMHVAAAFKKPIFSIWGNTVPEFGMNPYYGKNYELRITNYEFQVRGNFQKTDNIKLKLPAAVAQSPKLKARSLSCRPCSKIGFNKCPKGHFKCMEWQDVEAIAKQAEIFLNPK
jgi:ADP-heptose:LPS heptosyltransferase